MPQVPTAESGNFRGYTKTAGDEPLPGYRLLSPLGRGGFGEVWRCEAPGGLHKAIKFVTSDCDDGRGHERLGQELAAFEQIKSIRHPFLLTLERVELIEHDLVMVMELADRQLQDRFNECRACGLPGIPRDELLAYFADAAEALDMIAAKFNLQHLDIKPANLFLVAGHVKVGDYGLVSQLEGPGATNRGLTPRYVAPEVLHNAPSNRSDQYSLALVYHELLVGELPYSGRTPQQLMLQHVSGTPDLSALPRADRSVVGRALSKKPEERYSSCLAFVQALMASGGDTALPGAGMNLRRARLSHVDSVNDGLSLSDNAMVTQLAGRHRPSELGSQATPTTRPPLTTPDTPRPSMPALIPTGRPSQEALRLTPAPPFSDTETEAPPLAEETGEPGLVVLERIRSVVPVVALLGTRSPHAGLDPQQFTAALVQAAAAGGQAPQMPGDVGWLADGTWVCQFPSTVPQSVVRVKLALIHDEWGVSVEQPDDTHVLLRRTVGGGGGYFRPKPTFGYEAVILLPSSGKPLGEITVLGRTFGKPDPKCKREARDLLPKLLLDVRAALANVPDRRKYPRIPCEMPVNVYPMHSDGRIDAAVPATCRDVSLGGLGISTETSVRTSYVYVAFPEVEAVAKHAILMKLLRVQKAGKSRHYGTRFRTDL